MKCPKCSMVLKKQVYEGVEIDKCEKCKGTWLDAGELTNFAGVPQDEQRSVENCPICLKAMRANNYDYQSGVIVDTCVNGHGVWLDEKELEKVQIYREHWIKEADKHRTEWLAYAETAKESHANMSRENEKRKMRPIQYLLSSWFKKMMGV